MNSLREAKVGDINCNALVETCQMLSQNLPLLFLAVLCRRENKFFFEVFVEVFKCLSI